MQPGTPPVAPEPIPPAPGKTLGFLGTGAITAAIVTGLSTQPDAPPIVLSPRNAQVAAGLASRFANVRLAPTNQAVLDSCDIAFLAVRPQIAEDVLAQLIFRPTHHVVSLIALLSVQRIQALTAPAAHVTRAVPLPSVAYRQGPTAIYPPDVTLTALFQSLGTAIELTGEPQLDTFSTATAIMASYFAFAGTVSTWMAHQGVAPEQAHHFVAAVLNGLAAAPSNAPDQTFNTLATAHQTPGGLNEQVLRLLTEGGLFPNLSHALDAVLARIRAAQPAG